MDEDEAQDAPAVAAEPVRSKRAKGPVLVALSEAEIEAQAAALAEAARIAEAMVFAAEAPLEESDIAKRMPDGLKVADVMQHLRGFYENRGVNLVRVGKKWTFRTAGDLGWLLSREMQQQKKLSRAALETLAIIAYHQPTTRAEIEDIRGVAISKGTLDVLMETGWVRLRGRRKAPGRPVTYGTTDDFLLHFGLEGVSDLPGLDELKGAGLFDGRLPPGFGIPTPNDSADLTDDEDPLEEGDLLAYAEGTLDLDPEAGELVKPLLEAADELQALEDAQAAAALTSPAESADVVAENTAPEAVEDGESASAIAGEDDSGGEEVGDEDAESDSGMPDSPEGDAGTDESGQK